MAYSIGQEKTKLIVGLGNIGKKYVNTRHNVGFLVVESFATQIEVDNWIEKKDLKCLISSSRVGAIRVIVVKPTTLMNLSGEALQAVIQFYKIQLKDVVVVHDELDINYGQIRSRHGGGSAGHNGIKSVTQHIGENYGRLRIGIGPKTPEQIDSSDYVLSSFSKEEHKSFPLLLRESASWLSELLHADSISSETRSFII